MKMLHCKKCDGQAFRTISALRKHQWAKHAETFKNALVAMTRASKRAAAERQDKPKRGRPRKVLVKLQVSPNGQQPPLLARDLLAQLQTQQRFLNDVVSLVSGIVTQHEENK